MCQVVSRHEHANEGRKFSRDKLLQMPQESQ